MIWKDIKGYEGRYQVSDTGLVKSLERTCKHGVKGYRRVRERIIKPGRNHGGYLFYKGFRIHREVANEFLPKIKGKDYVNHIDGNKENNHVSNLEWCTREENDKHAVDLGLHTSVRQRKKVIQINKVGQRIEEYESIKQAARLIGINEKGIRLTCSGFYKQTHGYYFKYA